MAGPAPEGWMMKWLRMAVMSALLAGSAWAQLSERWSARFPESYWPLASSVVDGLADAG